MTDFYFPIGPVQFELVGKAINKLKDQGFKFVQFAYFGTAQVKQKLALPGSPNGQFITLYTLLMTYTAEKIEDVPRVDFKL